MKISKWLLFYLILFLVFVSGILIPKEADQVNTSPINNEKGKKATTKKELVSLSVDLKATKANRVLAASTQEVITTEKGDNFLVLINKNVRLPETYEPRDLEFLAGKVGVSQGGLRLRRKALDSLLKMTLSAKKSGISLIVTSAYRSYWSQLATYQNKVAAIGPEATKTFGAWPGHSQHQLGTAVDFSILDPRAIVWLETNAYKYGFVLSYPKGKEDTTGYVYEPWHYRFIGTRAAADMAESGLILEEYLQEYGIW